MLLVTECCLPFPVSDGLVGCFRNSSQRGVLAVRQNRITRREESNEAVIWVLSVVLDLSTKSNSRLIVTWSSKVFYSQIVLCSLTVLMSGQNWWKLTVAEDEGQFLYLDPTYQDRSQVDQRASGVVATTEQLWRVDLQKWICFLNSTVAAQHMVYYQ